MTDHSKEYENDVDCSCEEFMIDCRKPYGHAMCPSCYADVNLRDELNMFSAQSTEASNDFLFYFLCPDCGMKLSKLTPSEAKSFKQDVITLNTDRLINDDEVRYAMREIQRWCAVIRYTALMVHNFNPADAFEYGEPFSPPDTLVKINPSDFSQLMEKKLLINRNFGKDLEDDNDDD
jgi:hypothetical protein